MIAGRRRDPTFGHRRSGHWQSSLGWHLPGQTVSGNFWCHASVKTESALTSPTIFTKFDDGRPPVSQLGGSMGSVFPGRFSRSCVRALLVLLAWAVVNQGTAHADCRSHDLPTIPLSNRSITGSDGIEHATVPIPALADLAEIPGRSKPCTGPMCSGRPAMPLAPAAPDVQQIASWAILEMATPFLIEEPTESRRDDPGGRPTHSPTLIFHPPRLSPPLHLS
jgi:hypothetical protein